MTQLGGTSLALYLAPSLVQARADLPQVAAGALFERFVGWARAAGTP